MKDVEYVVESYTELWNTQEYSQIPEYVSESFVMHDAAAPEEGYPGPEGEVHGHDGLEKWMRQSTNAFPDLDLTLLEMASSGNIVMVEKRATGTHEGEFNGIEPTGNSIDIREMTKYRVENGKVQESHIYFDQQQLAEQLGLVGE